MDGQNANNNHTVENHLHVRLIIANYAGKRYMYKLTLCHLFVSHIHVFYLRQLLSISKAVHVYTMKLEFLIHHNQKIKDS